MRFEYLISEKGKRVLGTERMVRNCQRPKGRRSLLPAQEPLCSGQEAAARSRHRERSRVGSHPEMETATLRPMVAPPAEPCTGIVTPRKD